MRSKEHLQCLFTVCRSMDDPVFHQYALQDHTTDKIVFENERFHSAVPRWPLVVSLASNIAQLRWSVKCHLQNEHELRRLHLNVWTNSPQRFLEQED